MARLGGADLGAGGLAVLIAKAGAGVVVKGVAAVGAVVDLDVSGADRAVCALPVAGCSGTMPPALTNTGIRPVGTCRVWVDGPVKVAPVKKSVHVPGREPHRGGRAQARAW